MHLPLSLSFSWLCRNNQYHCSPWHVPIVCTAEFLDTLQDEDEGERSEANNTKMPSLPNMDQLLAKQKETKRNKALEAKKEAEANKPLGPEFDINCIAPSRTFLSIISSTENSIRWLTRVANEEDDDGSEMSKKSSFCRQQQSQEIDFMTNLDESIATNKTRKKKKVTKSKHTMKKPKSTRHKIDNNATLALEAIEHAKQLAKKEQNAAVLMTQRFTRFAQHPQLIQQQQQQLLLQQQQQAMYQLQDTAEKLPKASYDNGQPSASYENGQSYDEDEKMPVADDHLGVINEPEDEEDKMSSMLNGDDILDEAAKLAEWL